MPAAFNRREVVSDPASVADLDSLSAPNIVVLMAWTDKSMGDFVKHNLADLRLSPLREKEPRQADFLRPVVSNSTSGLVTSKFDLPLIESMLMKH